MKYVVPFLLFLLLTVPLLLTHNKNSTHEQLSKKPSVLEEASSSSLTEDQSEQEDVTSIDQFFSKSSSTLFHCKKVLGSLTSSCGVGYRVASSSIDVATFTAVPFLSGYYKDKDRVFFYERYRDGNWSLDEVPARPYTLASTTGAFIKDATSVFYKKDILPHSDANSFKVLSKKYSLDVHQVYIISAKRGDADAVVIQGADPETFSILNEACELSYDKNHVYQSETVLEGVSPKDAKNIECTLNVVLKEERVR